MPPSILTLNQVGLWREQTVILDDVTWRVAPGEHWAVLGPNGCGKTTLLNVVSGWLFPSRGTVSVLGQAFGACDMQTLRRQIGCVSSTVGTLLPPGLITLGVVLTGQDATLGIRKTPAPDDLARAAAQLAAVGLAARAELPFANLSTGERIRALIARALMRTPRLLILDEPCNGLDPVAREAFLEMLEQLLEHRPELTLVLVTHHLAEIPPAVSHVLALRAGRVIRAAPKADVLTAEVLEATFGAPFEVHRHGRRYAALPRLPLRADTPFTAIH
jgi:iron complex transport system ATP-binding protein